jgi:hypothetical protein
VAHALGKLTPGDRAHAGVAETLARLAQDEAADVRERAQTSLQTLHAR